jgi:DNA-binding XRE family transcriptional regulator
MSRKTSDATLEPRKLRIMVPQEKAYDALRERLARIHDVIITDGEHQHDAVVMLTTDYDALLERASEMAEDLSACLAHAQTAGEERVPIEVARRLVAGENPIRVWREYRGMTLDQLATASRLSKSYLSELENGKRQGPVDTLRSIAGALKVLLDDVT